MAVSAINENGLVFFSNFSTCYQYPSLCVMELERNDQSNMQLVFPFPTNFFFSYSLLDLAVGSLCLRFSSGTTFPHLFSCSVRLQGSRPTFEAPFSFVSLLCTPVINFVLLLFVPVNRSPLCWASSPRSTRLEVFSFVRVDRCLIEWWMSLYFFVIELPAFWLVWRMFPFPHQAPPESRWMAAKPTHPSV